MLVTGFLKISVEVHPLTTLVPQAYLPSPKQVLVDTLALLSFRCHACLAPKKLSLPKGSVFPSYLYLIVKNKCYQLGSETEDPLWKLCRGWSHTEVLISGPVHTIRLPVPSFSSWVPSEPQGMESFQSR